NIAVGADLVVNFSEDIKKGTVGDIVIKKVSDNSVVETIAVTADNITVSGSQLTINPIENLAQGTDYYVEIADGAIQDIAGNNYAGITGNSTWNFQTAIPDSGIQGIKWNDQNSNGVLDTGEEALSGWTIYLDGNQNGQLDTGEVSTVTNANGQYSFSNLGAGEYTIAEVSQSGWEQTYPTNPYSINLKTGGITGSPNPYITLISSPTDSNNDGYYEAVVKLNYEGALDQVKFVVDYDAVPTGWTVDIGDSVSNNGFGGDGGDTSNAAETQIMDTRIDAYTNTLPGHESVTDDGHLHILRVPNIVTGSGSKAILEVSNEHLGWDNLQGVKGTLDSPYLYTLNGQATTYGSIDYDVYASFNRVINNTYRLGTGASQITIIPVNTATHTVNLAAGETATDVNFGNREVNIDTTPPTTSSFTPTDDATNIAVAADLVVNFSEDIKKGTVGDIVIKKVSD
ncbi:MAG: Ig-like domain-containing protein, partial [Planktothrix sp.]